MGWNYLSISKRPWLHRWNLRMDKLFHPKLYNGFNYLSKLVKGATDIPIYNSTGPSAGKRYVFFQISLYLKVSMIFCGSVRSFEMATETPRSLFECYIWVCFMSVQSLASVPPFSLSCGLYNVLSHESYIRIRWPYLACVRWEGTRIVVRTMTTRWHTHPATLRLIMSAAFIMLSFMWEFAKCSMISY